MTRDLLLNSIESNSQKLARLLQYKQERKESLTSLVFLIRRDALDDLKKTDANFEEIIDNEILYLNEQIAKARDELSKDI
ncbi:MAG: hypothetical protein KGI50_07070 [Patescibacteria group bacterium]|nr:hypothetical protein [Patescibacteria group bacterium]